MAVDEGEPLGVVEGEAVGDAVADGVPVPELEGEPLAVELLDPEEELLNMPVADDEGVAVADAEGD